MEKTNQVSYLKILRNYKHVYMLGFCFLNQFLRTTFDNRGNIILMFFKNCSFLYKFSVLCILCAFQNKKPMKTK